MTQAAAASPVRPNDPSDAEKIRAVEAWYRACWACIQTGAQHACQHYRERCAEERLEQSRLNPAAVLATIEANSVAFANHQAQTVSPIETRLLEAFWRAGLSPVQQYPISGYVVDFAFPMARLVVEADGADYHQDEERECRRDEAIRRQGWHVIHLTGRAIHQDADSCVASVYRLARTSL